MRLVVGVCQPDPGIVRYLRHGHIPPAVVAGHADGGVDLGHDDHRPAGDALAGGECRGQLGRTVCGQDVSPQAGGIGGEVDGQHITCQLAGGRVTEPEVLEGALAAAGIGQVADAPEAVVVEKDHGQADALLDGGGDLDDSISHDPSPTITYTRRPGAASATPRPPATS